MTTGARVLAIQACIDLAAHRVADGGWGEPDDAGSAFDRVHGEAQPGIPALRDFLVAIARAAGI